MNLKNYLGDKRFFKTLAAVVLPIMIQNGITQFVGLLDNIMVGQVGTEPMSGVSIVNQLLFVFNLCMFGGMAGVGIFTAQFYGSGNNDGIRRAFRFKLFTGIAVCAVGYIVFLSAGDALIMRFLHESTDGGDLQLTFDSARSYLLIMLFSLPMIALTQAYASTLRETGKTVPPMVASLIAVGINLILNYLLIFGKFGCPKLGVAGAAIATVVSRVFESLIVVAWSHIHIKQNPYLKGVYRSLSVTKPLVKKIFIKGTPLLINEFMWSLGMTVMSQCYSTRGINAVAAFNISNTVSNLFGTVFISMGSAVAIILGQQLGAGNTEEAKDTCKKLISTSVVLSLFIGLLMALCSSLFPLMYETSWDVRHTAAMLIIVNGLWMPLNAYTNACYFTLRSGGQVIITMLFDSCFVWAVSVPAAKLLSGLTDLPVIPLFAICVGLDIIKCIIGGILVHSGKWARNIVTERKTEAIEPVPTEKIAQQ